MATKRTPTKASASAGRGKAKGNFGRVVSKSSVELNLAGIEAKARKTVRIPEGDYLAKVVSAATFTSNNGNPGIKWSFEVIEGKYKGAGPYYNNTMLGEESLWAVRGTLQAMKPAVKIPESAFKLDLKKYIGKTVALTLVDDEYDGRIRSTIDDVFHPDLLEADEEDEEEEEGVEEDEDEDEEGSGSGDEEDSDEDDEAEEEEDEAEGDEEGEELLTKAELRAMDLAELRKTAKEFDLSTKGLTKADLVTAILEAQEGDEEDLDDEEYEE